MSQATLMANRDSFAQSITQRALSNRPLHLTRDQIRSTILLNPQCDLWVVETEQLFVLGMGPRELNSLNEQGIKTATECHPSGHYHVLKHLVEEHHGEWVAVPLEGYSLAHKIEPSEKFDQITITTQVVELTAPWYEVSKVEYHKLHCMSQAICQAAWLYPETFSEIKG